MAVGKDTRGIADGKIGMYSFVPLTVNENKTSRKSKYVGHDGLKNPLSDREKNYMIQVP